MFSGFFVLYTNQRPFVFSKQQQHEWKWREILELRMSLAGVKYGKYAPPVPDVVTYEFYEGFSFQ
jgi:hypothetical protein